MWEEGYESRCQKTRLCKNRKNVNMLGTSNASWDTKSLEDAFWLVEDEFDPLEPSTLDALNEPEQLTAPEANNVFPALTK